MNKQEIYAFLKAQGIPYEITEHKAVYNIEELRDIENPHPEWDAKNLFVRDDKKQHYYLITVKGEKRVDLKEFRKQHGLRPLSFATQEELLRILGLTPGAVTPLGILNDTEHVVTFALDKALQGAGIGIHPNDNTATVWMRSDDLMRLIREHGNSAEYTEL